MPDRADLQVITGRLEHGAIDSAQYPEQVMRGVATFDTLLARMVGTPDILHT